MRSNETLKLGADFDGETYEPALDKKRLSTLLARVHAVMSDCDWHTIAEIHVKAGGSEASVSARIRDLRKEKFGGHVVERKRTDSGLFHYRLGMEQRDFFVGS